MVRHIPRVSVRTRSIVAGAVLTAAGAAAGGVATVSAQVVPAPLARVSFADAVRLTVERNQNLRAQRLTIDQAKADETTAGLKPNPGLFVGADGLTPFSPSHLTGDLFRNGLEYTSSLSYLFERGGKRLKRTTVAQDATALARMNVDDLERQVRFQAEQAFVDALLAKSTLEMAQENLKSFSDVVEVNRQRVAAGDLAEAEFFRISLQKLQFEQDVSSAQVGLIQAKAALRQLMGFEAVADDFDVEGTLTAPTYPLNLEDLKRLALENRPDVLAAHAAVQLAQDTLTLERGNRARDVSGNLGYTHLGPDNTIGVGVAIDLPIHDRNQGNIARSEIGVRQAVEAETAARFAAVTDVVNAYAAFDTNRKVVALYESGYLSQARQSLDITTYVYQRGAGTLLDLLDAERTYRDTELAYRQALAAYMTSLRQLNFAVGKQVIP